MIAPDTSSDKAFHLLSGNDDADYLEALSITMGLDTPVAFLASILAREIDRHMSWQRKERAGITVWVGLVVLTYYARPIVGLALMFTSLWAMAVIWSVRKVTYAATPTYDSVRRTISSTRMLAQLCGINALGLYVLALNHGHRHTRSAAHEAIQHVLDPGLADVRSVNIVVRQEIREVLSANVIGLKTSVFRYLAAIKLDGYESQARFYSSLYFRWRHPELAAAAEAYRRSLLG